MYRGHEDELKDYYIYQMDKIINEYSGKYEFHSTKEYSAYCYIGTKEIYIPESYKRYPCSKFLFDIYHEIGHLETNSLDMESYQQEYLATVWAIKTCNKRKIRIAPQTIAMYQRYIGEHRDKSPNRSKISDRDIALPILLNPGTNRNVVDIPADLVREVPRGKANKKSTIPDNMDIIDYLKSRNVEFVDKRIKGGNITIVGTEASIGELVDTICSAYGISGRYGTSLKAIKNRAGWWTKG